MKGDTMKPLIDILEEERTLIQKLESIHHYTLKTDDPEILNALAGRKKAVEYNLDAVRDELREYVKALFDQS